MTSASGEDRGDDNSVRVWDVASGEERLCLVHERGVYCVTFSPDGKTIATGGKDWTVIFWDVDTGREIRRLDEHAGIVENIAYSPDGRLLASVCMNSNLARLWDVDTGKEIRQFTGDGRELKTVAFSPDGTKIVAGGDSSSTMMWDVKTGKTVRTYGREYRPGSGAALSFSPDGKLLATCDGDVYVYDAATGKVFGDGFNLRRGDNRANRLAFSPDGKALILGGNDGYIRVWDYVADRAIGQFPAGQTHAFAMTRDGRYFATGGYGNVVEIWEAASGTELHAHGPRGPICFVGFAPAGTAALVEGGGMAVWDLAGGKEPLRIKGRRGVAMPNMSGVIGQSPDGKTIVTGEYSVGVRLVDTVNGKEIRNFDAPPRMAIRAVFTPDGKQAVFLEQDMRTMFLWDLRGGKEICRFVAHSSPLVAIAITRDGKRLISSGTARATMRQMPPGFVEDSAARVWDMATGKELRQFPSRDHSFAFSPDGSLLAAANDWQVRMIDPVSGEMIRLLQGPKYGANRVAFSPDGKTLAGVGRDKKIWLWEVATGAERRTFTGHTGDVFSVAFPPDGRRLLTGGADTTAILWDVYATEKPVSDLATAVQSLESSDAADAHRAICNLVSDPDRAVPLLAAAIQPAAPPDPQRLARLVAGLDSPQFADREKSTSALIKLADMAEPALRDLLAGKPSPEARQRAEKILDGLKKQSSPALLRGLRTVEALEAIATPASRKELERLAGGAPGVSLTREATAAVSRLNAREERHWTPPSVKLPGNVEELLGGPVKGGIDADGKALPLRAIARFGTLPEPGKGSVRYVPSRDASLAVVFGYELPTIRILDLPSGRERVAIKPPFSRNWFNEVAFSPDGTKLAADNSTGADLRGTLFVWDAASGKELWRSSGGVTGLGSLAWSPDNKMVATSGGKPRAIRVWDVGTGKEIRNWTSPYHHTVIGFSEDSKRIVTSYSARRALDIETGNELKDIDAEPGGGRPGGRIRAAKPIVTQWEPLALKGPMLFEPATGELRLRLKGHPSDHDLFYIAIAPDGRTAASGDNKGMLFVWDLTGLAPDGKFPKLSLTDAERDGLWRLLAGDDAEIAYRAGWRLTAGGDETVAFIKSRLTAVPKAIGPHVEKLIADLSARNEPTRQEATDRLAIVGPLAAPALQAALAGQPAGETRDRLEYLLERANRAIPNGELLHAIRSVEVLERIASPQARALLADLAAGHADADLTREAANSLKRLADRKTEVP